MNSDDAANRALKLLKVVAENVILFKTLDWLTLKSWLKSTVFIIMF